MFADSWREPAPRGVDTCAIPGEGETDAQPPMAVPLRHFLVGLAALLAGGALGLAAQVGLVAGFAGLAHVHLLLVVALLALTADGLVGVSDAALAAAGVAFLTGAGLFVAKMALVVRNNSLHSVPGILAGRSEADDGHAPNPERGDPGH